MKRPLGLVALGYGLGLMLAELVELPLLLLFGVAISTAAAALLARSVRNVLVWPVIVLTAWTNLQTRVAVLSPFDLRIILTENAEEVTLRGHLDGTPDERIVLRDGTETFRTIAEISVTEICRDHRWQPAHGRVVITTPGVLASNCFSGQEVEVSGVIAPPPSALATGLFDYRNYLQRQGIHFQLRAGPEEWRLIEPLRGPSLSDRFLDWAGRTTSLGLPEIDQATRLLWAMTLGSRNVVANEFYVPFVRSGTMHIFAISGLHIALIAGILVAVCRVIRIPRTCCGILIVPLLWFYAGATGWQASAVRATLMMTIVIAGWSLSRPSNLLNSLATAALIILVWDPQQLFQAGFQLSFFVVLSIALILPPLEKARDRWLRFDPLIPEDLIPLWQKWLMAGARHVATGLATSTAAWLGSWPITALYFHLFSPVTLLANLIMVPLSSAALACNLSSLFFGFWMPVISELFNHSAWFWMSGMMKAGELAVKLPGAYLFVAAPAPIDLVLYYSALVGFLTGIVFRPRLRPWMFLAVGMIAIFYGIRWQRTQAATDLVIIPFRGGTAIYCDAPGSASDLLLDCGSPYAVQHAVEPILRSRGVDSLPRLILSHGDIQVSSGAGLLVQSMPASEVITNGFRFRSAKYRAVLRSLSELPVHMRPVQEGSRIGAWTVLHPDPAGPFSVADDAALVLRGTFNGVKVLMLSELGHLGQESLLNRGIDLRADIVIAGIPSRTEPLRDGLLASIQPSLIVIADSDLPSKRASPNLKTRLSEKNIPVLYIRDAGTISIRIRNNRWKLGK